MTPDRVFQIRQSTGVFGCTQEHFANNIGVSVRTYRNWEQGVKKPTGAARSLLLLIEARPDEMIECFGEAIK